MVRTLLVDNYDSFTYNLFQLLAEVNGIEPVVLHNDDLAGWDRLGLASVDNIVISPGPGRPERERDFGISARALERTDLPVLGVCLGHQGLCHHHGAEITHAPEPMHGRLSAIHHRGGPLFASIPTPFSAVRYHSLTAARVPDALEVVATTSDGLLMAVRHRRHPHWGVQFHPESIATEHGLRLLANFRDITVGGWDRARRRRAAPAPRPGCTARGAADDRAQPGAREPAPERHRLLVADVARVPDAERAFDALAAAGPVKAWLDSASAGDERSRFSIIGLPSEELGEVVTYAVRTGEVTVSGLDGTVRSRHREPWFDYLERQLERRRVPDPGLPCEFALGYVGYLGYELKAECGAAAAHASSLPDAGLVYCDRALVLDHRDRRGWLLALTTTGRDAAVRGWLADTGDLLERLAAEPGPSAPEPPPVAEPRPVPYTVRHEPDEYLELISACQRAITDGESYEICLTNMITAPFSSETAMAYKVLRRVNPAPYAAFLELGPVSVLSSSPERFLAVDRHGAVESKPIKGTRARAADPARDAALATELEESEKDRAENLMIVDLVRNDLGRLGEVGSVHVPTLFGIESFASVHQMVSTIRARLRPGTSPVRCVQASFPGGSMTGAPKLRTMEIIDALEGGPRGVYSGALGFFSLNGAVDLSIVIRTVVLAGGEAQVGMGGAIVALSDPYDELEETMVKAAPLLRALAAASEAAAPPWCDAAAPGPEERHSPMAARRSPR